MKRIIQITCLFTAGFIATAALAQDGKVPIKMDPPPTAHLVGTPVPITGIPNLEPELKALPVVMAPPGTVNLAKGKKVTGSDDSPITGDYDLVTDGDKTGDEGTYVELGAGKQWIQIDLEKEANIYAVVVWHFTTQKRAYRDVVVQVSNDPEFKKDVTTIFDNTTGTGKDRPYIENNVGKLIEAKGVRGRFVRLYSSGNTTNKLNDYVEVEVFGTPVK